MFAPQVDVYESDTDILILADVPGVSKEDVEIVVVGETLTLTARAAGPAEGKPVRADLCTGDWRRRFEVHGVDAKAADAELKDGVLTIRLPKAQARVCRSIEIGSG